MTALALTKPAELRETSILPGRGGFFGQLSDAFWRHPRLLLFLMLTPPLLWLGIIYIGSLIALLLQSFFSIDDFSGLVNYEFTLATYAQLLSPTNFDIIIRTIIMAALVTLASAVVAFPIAYYAARYAQGKWKALFYLGVMLPLWSSYLGTFLVFVYVWLPYMILPTQAALERVPGNLIEASSDLGATPSQTFRTVLFPLALPGIVAGSIFTFSLTLGDYIIPQIIGSSRLFIGQAVYAQQGTAGNVPLAAAFSVVPIVIMAVYLWLAKKQGAFDAL